MLFSLFSFLLVFSDSCCYRSTWRLLGPPGDGASVPWTSVPSCGVDHGNGITAAAVAMVMFRPPRRWCRRSLVLGCLPTRACCSKPETRLK